MGYDRAQINAAVEEVRRNYEQFLEWAVDGRTDRVHTSEHTR